MKPSYRYYGNHYTGKTSLFSAMESYTPKIASSYWISALCSGDERLLSDTSVQGIFGGVPADRASYLPMGVARCYVCLNLCQLGQTPLLLMPWVRFHKGFMSPKSSGCYYFKNKDQIMSQFCSCHDSSTVVTSAKLGHICYVKIIIKTKIIFVRFHLWAQKSVVKMALAPCVPW